MTKLEHDFIYGTGNMYAVYQLSQSIRKKFNARLISMQEFNANGLYVSRSDYKFMYSTVLEKFLDTSADRRILLNRIYTHRSLSLSDVIVLRYNGTLSAYFVDIMGFLEQDNAKFFGEELFADRSITTVQFFKSQSMLQNDIYKSSSNNFYLRCKLDTNHVISWYTGIQKSGRINPYFPIKLGWTMRVVDDAGKLVFEEYMYRSGTAKKMYPFSWEYR